MRLASGAALAVAAVSSMTPEAFADVETSMPLSMTEIPPTVAVHQQHPTVEAKFPTNFFG